MDSDTRPAWRGLPFQPAIAYLRSKELVPTEHWYDLTKVEHDTGFMVAGATKAALLNDLHQACLSAVEKGTSFKTFQDQFDEAVKKHGWDFKGEREWRTRLIFATNVRTAYQAGRYAQMTSPAMVAARPFWQYRHGHSRSPREDHLSWDGLVLRWDDPFWQEHYPPNGYNCSCEVRPLNKRDLTRMGMGGPDKTPERVTYEWTNPKTKKVEQIPKGVDPGWNYAPGASRVAQLQQALTDQAASLHQPIGEALKADLQKIGSIPDTTTRVTTRQEAKALGGRVLDRMLAKTVNEDGTTLGEAIHNASLTSPNTVALADSFRAALLDELAKVRKINTPAKIMGTKNSGHDAVRAASTRFPDEWTTAADALGPLWVREATGRAWAFTAKADGIVQPGEDMLPTLARAGDGFIGTRGGSDATHEYVHRLQAALPGLDRLFQEEHRERTQGEALIRLDSLYPDGEFEPNEVARKDKYIEPFMGMEYTHGGALELMPTLYQMLLGRRKKSETSRNDLRLLKLLRQNLDLALLALGLLFGWMG